MKPLSTSRIILIGLSLLIGLSWFTRASAAPVDDYHARLAHALALIQQLQTHVDEDPTQRGRFAITIFAEVRSDLPEQEPVLFAGQSITVDNRWLYQALNNYERAKSDADRSAQATAIGERLLAISERLDELKQSSTNSSKDESKARLAEILRRSEYNKTAAEGSALGRLWAAFVRWLISLFPQTKPLQPGSSRFLSAIVQIIVVAVAVAAIGLLVWKFLPRYIRNRGKKKKKREVRIILGERLEPDQTSNDLLAQAEALARSGDLRAAIRKAYIALLCELGDRKVISLAQHKTNRDYLLAVRDRRPLFESMRDLTNSFELHWYGFVPAQEIDWDSFRTGYDQALAMGAER